MGTKRKLTELAAFFLLIGGIGYTYGQCGNLQLDKITIGQFIVKAGIGIVFVAISAWIINRHWKDGEWI